MTEDFEELKNRVEAVIFAAGRKVTLEECARLCRTRDVHSVNRALKELKQEYDARNSPLLLTPEADGWKLTVKEKYLGMVREITPHMELNKALLETLAVIAWKHPVLQSEVVKIRSTAAYEHIKELMELGFVNREKKGRSYLLKVSGKFFDYFDLPDQAAVQEAFKDVKDSGEAQQKITEQQQRLGKLNIYAVPKDTVQGAKEKEILKAEEEAETGHLGALDIYETTPALEKAELEDAEESALPEPEERTETEEQGAQQRREIGQTAEQFEEEARAEQEAEEEQREDEEREEERRLPEELERFAEEGEEEERRVSKLEEEPGEEKEGEQTVAAEGEGEEEEQREKGAEEGHAEEQTEQESGEGEGKQTEDDPAEDGEEEKEGSDIDALVESHQKEE